MYHGSNCKGQTRTKVEGGPGNTTHGPAMHGLQSLKTALAAVDMYAQGHPGPSGPLRRASEVEAGKRSTVRRHDQASGLLAVHVVPVERLGRGLLRGLAGCWAVKSWVEAAQLTPPLPGVGLKGTGLLKAPLYAHCCLSEQDYRALSAGSCGLGGAGEAWKAAV